LDIALTGRWAESADAIPTAIATRVYRVKMKRLTVYINRAGSFVIETSLINVGRVLTLVRGHPIILLSNSVTQRD
jgi:hypothetical protein